MTKTIQKERFIELRAEGASFDTCARELGKSKTTLIKWQRELDTEIKNMKYLKTQYILEKYKITKEKRIEFFSKEVDRILSALAKKDYEELSVKDLYALLEKLVKTVKEETESIEYETGEIIVTDTRDEPIDLGIIRKEEKLSL